MSISDGRSPDVSEPEQASLLAKNSFSLDKAGSSGLGSKLLSQHNHSHNHLHHLHPYSKQTAAFALSDPQSGSSSPSLPPSSASSAPSASASSPPSSQGRVVSSGFKMVLFFSIVTWSTSAALIVRYSQGVLKEKYSIVGSVVVTEVIKLGLSTLAVCRDHRWSLPDTARRCLTIMGTSLPMAIPAVVYLVQNTLNYIALQSIPSATHAILVQLKLLTTAIFAVLILRKQIFFYQWRALFLLFIGIVLVQWPTSSPTPPPAGPLADTALSASTGVGAAASTSWLLSGADLVARYGGVMAATTQAALSGFSGVYTEWRLKGRGNFTLWENNFQLCFYSIVIGAFSLLFSSDLQLIRDKGFFSGYSVYTWSCIALNSWGGLMVAAILLYCDNILKNFASSVSILATSILGYAWYGEPQFTINFFCGACVLISAIFIYNEDIIALASHMQQTRREVEEQLKQQGGHSAMQPRHSTSVMDTEDDTDGEAGGSEDDDADDDHLEEDEEEEKEEQSGAAPSLQHSGASEVVKGKKKRPRKVAMTSQVRHPHTSSDDEEGGAGSNLPTPASRISIVIAPSNSGSSSQPPLLPIPPPPPAVLSP